LEWRISARTTSSTGNRHAAGQRISLSTSAYLRSQVHFAAHSLPPLCPGR
jgi:hypothetical protein